MDGPETGNGRAIESHLSQVLSDHATGAVVMLELPTEAYFDANLATVEGLLALGFEGVYVSVNRPFPNLVELFGQRGIDLKKLLFVDVATALADTERTDDPRCIHVSPELDIDELVRAIYMSIERLSRPKRFVFIDSLTTITLYKPLSETLRFSEFLLRTIRKHHDIENVSLVVNVAADLAQKRFIKDVALKVDEVIKVSL
ncbi:MAG: hypothetical protein QF415_09905 [Candidatus Undinarchaeales archaeon]|nr:hypothetical protein [Candidatus Undinarchaeales archaeon]MDP7492867.1 hypothetical protein [Candidatus Undinarchaeales archaeon]